MANLRCSSCGWSAATDDARFCKRCGHPLSREEPVQGAETDELVREHRILDGRYEVMELLGCGGMGKVYRVRHTALDGMFALKLMRGEFSRLPDFRERFHREAKLAALLFHPHSVIVRDYGEHEGTAFLVMEYLKGASLAQYVQLHPDRRLPLAQAVDIALPIAQVLAHAHEHNIVHRDIKPSNVWLVQQQGQLAHVKVLDFGLARALGQASITRDALRPPGTLAYMAPEMWRLDHEDLLSTKVDSYALGVLLFEILVGEPPFEGSDEALRQGHLHDPPPRLSVQRCDPAVSAEFDEFIDLLLAKNPADRPTAADAVTALYLLRRNLPPASIRGLLAQETVLLTRAQEREDFHSQKTKVLERRVRELTEDLPKLHELNVLDSQIDHASETLVKAADELLRRVWKEVPPPVALCKAELGQALRDCKAAEQQLEQGRAAFEKQQKQLYERCGALQQQIFRLRDELARCRLPSEKTGLKEQLEAIERQMSALSPAASPDPAYSRHKQSVVQTRQVLLDQRRRFAVAVLVCFGSVASSQAVIGRALVEELERALARYDNLLTHAPWLPDARPTSMVH